MIVRSLAIKIIREKEREKEYYEKKIMTFVEERRREEQAEKLEGYEATENGASEREEEGVFIS